MVLPSAMAMVIAIAMTMAMALDIALALERLSVKGWVSGKAVCRTALAILGLLNMIYCSW